MTRTDTEDLPVLKRGILYEEPKPALAYWIVKALIVAAMVMAVIVSCISANGCAIPVRPIAKTETGSDGLPHFIPDPEQEPQVADSLPWLAALAKFAGPWGDAIGVGITLLGTGLAAHHVGHRRGKAKGAAPTITYTRPQVPVPGFSPDDQMSKPPKGKV